MLNKGAKYYLPYGAGEYFFRFYFLIIGDDDDIVVLLMEKKEFYINIGTMHNMCLKKPPTLFVPRLQYEFMDYLLEVVSVFFFLSLCKTYVRPADIFGEKALRKKFEFSTG